MFSRCHNGAVVSPFWLLEDLVDYALVNPTSTLYHDDNLGMWGYQGLYLIQGVAWRARTIYAREVFRYIGVRVAQTFVTCMTMP